MYGTLAGALSARNVRFDRSRYTADVEGTIEGVGQTIRISAIAMHYKLAIPAGSRAETDRALEFHPRGCPAHESVKDAIRITWDAEISEV
ncbi:MAG TPA: OsmC family protein [Dehalococcoidia bacterium]|nr:OsmC family protein [Dehalococcoidia bacterium]